MESLQNFLLAGTHLHETPEQNHGNSFHQTSPRSGILERVIQRNRTSMRGHGNSGSEVRTGDIRIALFALGKFLFVMLMPV
jgi:hypothetical protein